MSRSVRWRHRRPTAARPPAGPAPGRGGPPGRRATASPPGRRPAPGPGAGRRGPDHVGHHGGLVGSGAQVGRRRRAWARNAATAGPRGHVGPAGLGHRQRAEAHDVLVGQAQGLAGRGQHREPRARPPGARPPGRGRRRPRARSCRGRGARPPRQGVEAASRTASPPARPGRPRAVARASGPGRAPRPRPARPRCRPVEAPDSATSAGHLQDQAGLAHPARARPR